MSKSMFLVVVVVPVEEETRRVLTKSYCRKSKDMVLRYYFVEGETHSYEEYSSKSKI